MLRPCPVDGCEEPIAAEKLMCRVHWFMVPERLRTEVTRAWHQYCARREDRQRLERLRTHQEIAVGVVNARIARTKAPE